MKNFIFSAIVSTTLFVSCANTPDGAKSTTSDTKEAAALTGNIYKIDMASSHLNWEGTGVGHGHKGSFPIISGELSANEKSIVGGNFQIDVKGIATTDLKGKEASELIGHLLSKDFFESEKYPQAKFSITSVAPNESADGNVTISGNLTLKDSTKNVSFPAKVTMAANEITADAKFTIDRTQWGMYYNSEKSVGDHFISPSVGISIQLKAAK
jgi:polyisoprenoid-binding protein YceI